MAFSPRLVILAVLILVGLLVLLFSNLHPAASLGSAGGIHFVYLPFLFR
jgi:hypothetical protein